MSESAFVDPRSRPLPDGPRPNSRTTRDPAALGQLLEFCKGGRHYDVEAWIRAGNPLQLTSASVPRRWTSALEIALHSGSHALALLLLCNGYDPTLEQESPLNLALRARRWDLVDLLLDWGADPRDVNLHDLCDTYRTELYERFLTLGVDLTRGHALAQALAEHTSNKPLFGFAKRRVRDPRVQLALNMALAEHVEDRNEKGINLCLWAGADPHAPAPDLRYAIGQDESDDDEDSEPSGLSAVWIACLHGDSTIVALLGPDPNRDEFDRLYSAAGSASVVKLLAERQLPEDVGGVLMSQLSGLTYRSSHWRTLYVVQCIFEAGARWVRAPADEIASLRRLLLRIPASAFIDVMKLLATRDYCSPDVLQELGRTPAMRARMKSVGFIPTDRDESRGRHVERSARSREVLSKFGVELPKPPKSDGLEPRPIVPSIVGIGNVRDASDTLELSRTDLYERVWAQPVAQLAPAWGISDVGLAKACRRLQVPLPPRGYWAKVRAGKRPRRTRLPRLKADQGGGVIIRVPGP